MLRNLNVFRWLLLAAVSAALLAMGWVAPAAQAHAALLRSDPAAGAGLDRPPAEIRMWFAEPLETSYTGADLLDAAGNSVAATVAIAPDDGHQLVLTPPSGLADGAYTVAWRTLPVADGHTLQGHFGFRIGAGTASGFVPAAAPEGNETVRALTRGLALLGLAAVLALAPITLGVLDPTVSAVPTLGAALPVSLRRYGVIAALLALVTSVAALTAQAVTISPGVPLLAARGQTLTDTRYGQIWAARLLGATDAARTIIGGGRIGHALQADRIIDATRDALPTSVFDQAWAAGRTLSTGEAIAEALMLADEVTAETRC